MGFVIPNKKDKSPSTEDFKELQTRFDNLVELVEKFGITVK